MEFDTVIAGGLAVSSTGAAAQDIGVRDGRIARLGDLSGADAGEVIDASGKYVFPGFIDAHSHPVYGDDMSDYSKVIAYSGITTIIPFVGAVPAWGLDTSDTLTVVDRFISEAQKNSTLDFSVHTTFATGIDPDAEVSGMRDRGIVSGKMFTCFPERGLYQDDHAMYRLMRALAREGCVAMVHPENDAIVTFEQQRLIDAGATTIHDYPLSRPAIAEAEAVFRACSIAEVTGCPLYLVHLSSQETIDVVRWFRERNRVPIYAETCTHYLSLTDEDFERLGALIKISPPIRQRADQDVLWAAIADGTLDVVATDGSGQTRERKQDRTGNVFDIPFGISGSQSMVPLVYSEGVNTGRISLPDLARVWAERPAKIFGLYPRKGCLEVGSDADVTIVDPTAVDTLGDSERGGHSDYSPYAGRQVVGLPTVTMQRGRVVLRDGELEAAPGSGEFIHVGR